MISFRSFVFAALLAAAALPVQAQVVWRGVELGVGVKPADISDLAPWNVNVVRFSLIWADPAAADAADEAEYNAWLADALQQFEELLPVLEERGIKVVLDLHTPPGAFARRDNKATHRLFLEEWAQAAFVRTWELLAQRYQGSQVIAAFDLLNEPAQYAPPAAPLKDWKALAAAAISAIRAIDPARTVVVGPPYGDAKRLAAFGTLPFENLIYTIHFYLPFRFLHQGVGRMPLGVRYPAGRHDKRFLLRQLQPAADFQRRYSVPLYVGEFAANRYAPRNSGYRYLRDVLNIFEGYGWSWTYHAYRGADVFSVEHGTNPSDKTPAAVPTNRLNLLLKYFGQNISLVQP